MKNLSAQCPKSAAELIRILDEEVLLSPGFSEITANGKKILFLISSGVPEFVENALKEAIKNKHCTVIKPDEHESGPDFDFFGVTKGRVPILMDKVFLSHDTIITISSIKYDGLFGFTGGNTLIFPGLAAQKSKFSLLKNALDEKNFYKNAFCAPGTLKNNPLNADALDAAMIMRQNAVFFGINLLPSPDGNIAGITCGDIFMSRLRAAERFAEIYPLTREKPFTGITLRLGNTGLQEAVGIIEQASLSLTDGGRMFIDGSNLTSFGTEKFAAALNMPKREEIFAKLQEDFSFDVLQAMILKYLCGRYHIAISSPLEERHVRQAGLNPADGGSPEDFLKDSSEIGEIRDAGGFAAG